MSLLNDYTTDLHQDVHVTPLSRGKLMSVEFPMHFSCQTLSDHQLGAIGVAEARSDKWQAGVQI